MTSKKAREKQTEVREDRAKQKRRDHKKTVEKMLLHSAFNTPEKREYNKTHKNQIP